MSEETSPERWREIEALVQSALEHEGVERASFLDRACGGEAWLRSRVEDLIASYHEAEAEEFLERKSGPASGARSAEVDPEHRAGDPGGRRFGSYRILRRIAAGGMGTVYLAERGDDAFRRLVAIKVIRHGLGSGEVARRFRGEQHILASLDHPFVARLFDGGTSEEGEPYFVMEYVDGTPIDAYCDQHRLTVAQRLRLFRKVCAAVGYAHQNLVVHRDLKPSNILVTPMGEPKLLDFGIAKVLQPERAPFAVDRTRTGLKPMTPRYASPEQVRGEAIGTASDTYALGVLLYELLAGRSPYRLESDLPHELEGAICEQQPVPPSACVAGLEPSEAIAVGHARRIRPAELRRQLRGDLDHVVAKALRKEPRRRYGSVEGLSEDLRRFLASEPVAARRGSFAYRAGKLLRRYRVAVGVLASVALMALLFIAALLRQARDLASERERSERALALLVDTFMISEAGLVAGEAVTAKRILDTGADKVMAELGDEPVVQATLMDAIGQIYASLGLYGEAAPLLERALEQRREIFGPRHLEVAASLHHLAQVRHESGRYGEAEGLFREALAIRRRQGEDDLLIAETLDGLATTLRWSGQLQGSEPIHREALEIRRRELGDRHPLVAQSLDGLASLHLRLFDYDRAEELYREAVEIDRLAFGEEHPQTAMALKNLGLTLQLKGDWTGAREILTRTLEVLRRTLGEEHPWVTQNRMNLARLALDAGDLATAQSLTAEALAFQRRTLGADHPDTAIALRFQAEVLLRQGKLGAAEAPLRQALAIVENRLKKDHPYAGRILEELGTLRLQQGRLDDAEDLFRRAMAVRRRGFGEERADLSRPLLGLGRVAVARGDPAGAEDSFRASLDHLHRRLAVDHWRVAVGRAELGAALLAAGRGEEAAGLLEPACSRLRELFAGDDPRMTDACRRLSAE